jgi:hypothetical protein
MKNNLKKIQDLRVYSRGYSKEIESQIRSTSGNLGVLFQVSIENYLPNKK